MMRRCREHSLKPMRRPADYICLEDAQPVQRTMFVGKADDPNKYLTINRYIRYYFRYPNPFDLIKKPANAPSSSTPDGSAIQVNFAASPSSSVPSGSPSTPSTFQSAAPIGRASNSSQSQSARGKPCRCLL
jgi:hypothetical protein